jgi:hypothetical protein
MYSISSDQKNLVRVVVGAINAGDDAHVAVKAQIGGQIPKDDVNSVIRILRSPMVRFRRGQDSASVVARLCDALDAAERGDEYEPPPYVDDRY